MIRYQLFVILLLLQNQEVIQAEEETCSGAFDVYFVIDISSSLLKGNINHLEKETVSFVTALSRRFVNPLLRMSYITFSTTAHVVMPLTNNRDTVERKLVELKSIIPEGPTLMHLGIEKANNQIASLHDKRASIIIVLTDGKLEYRTKVQAVTQSERARKLGSTLFVVGVSNYDNSQLLAIAGGSPRFVFHAEDFSQLDRVVNEILISSCVEVLSAEPDRVCSNQTFSLVIRGKGFNNTGITSLIKCNFWTEDYTDVLVSPDEVGDGYLKCSSPTGFTLKNEEKITVQVSLNGGVSFVSSNVTVTAYICTAPSATFWLILFVLFMLILFGLWWISNFICCVATPTKPAPKPEKPPRPVVKPPVTGKTQWPAVDASQYGAAGAGGIKPLPVRWGELGCTEAAMHLERTKDAKTIVRGTRQPGDIDNNQSDPPLKTCSPFALCFAPLAKFYAFMSMRRPTKEEVGNCVCIRKRLEEDQPPTKRGSYLDTTA